MLSTWSKRIVASRYQLISVRQLACWLLFFLGLLWHSRISALAALAALAYCFAGVTFVPVLRPALIDIHFVYILLAIFIACSGLYLAINRVTLVCLAILSILLAATWTACAGSLPGVGLPLLCGPLNVGLAGIVWLLTRCQGQLGDCLVIPPELSATSPEVVEGWLHRKHVAQQCWDKLARFYDAVARTAEVKQRGAKSRPPRSIDDSATAAEPYPTSW